MQDKSDGCHCTCPSTFDWIAAAMITTEEYETKECLQLCYMDMDSLVYSIKTEDFYADIADDIPTRFDTSSYLPDHPLPISLNKKVIGLMKDELGGAIMTEFVALRPKLYFCRVLSGVENKKCKGIKKCVVKKTLTFEDYKACFFNSKITYRSQLMFRSIKHKIFMPEVNKVALNRDDDKRISRKDGISTLAHGHKPFLEPFTQRVIT